MEKVRCPRFIDHIDLGEKPKYKSFLLRLHREAAASQQAKDECLQRQKMGEANLDMIPKRMLPHPKKRMQMYKEIDAFDDTSNEGDHSDASRKSFESNVPSEYTKRHQPTTEPPYLLAGSYQPNVTSNTSVSETLRTTNASNQLLENNLKRGNDVLEQNSVNWQRKEVSDFSMLQHSRSNVENDQNEQSKSNKFNFNDFKSNLISESDQNNYEITENFRFDDDIRNHLRIYKNICRDSLMEYETDLYPLNGHRRIYAPNAALHFNPQKSPHNEHLKQSLDVFDVNEKLLTITSNPGDLQLHTRPPQINGKTNREKFPRIYPSITTEKKIYSEFAVSKNNPQVKRLQGNHPSTLSQTVPPSPMYPPRQCENPEDLRLPNSSRLLEELISAVSSRRQSELPQLVPSRPARTKQLPIEDRASQDQQGQHRKRHPNGDVEQWQHERRREHNGHRSAGEPYPQHTSAFHPNPNYQPPNVPYPRTSNGGGPSYPPASPHYGYGYSPAGPNHPYSREYPQAPPQALPQAPPPLSARDKTISWLSGGEPLCSSPPRTAGSSSYTETKGAARRVDDYKSCPMSEWESRDVAHFLIEATHDLGIRYENTDFSQLNQVDGRKLLSMETKHFEKFTPTEGQRVYDYVRRHRNHEMLTKEDPNENYRGDGQHQSIVTPPPLNVDTNSPSMFPSDVYEEYPSLQPSPTLNGSMAYDLQSSTISAQPFHGPGNTSIPVGSIGPPISPDPIPLNHYHSPGMMPNHSSAGYPPPGGGMFASPNDQYQYPGNSVASGSHTGPNGPHLLADGYPTAVNKTFYSLHDPSAMYPSSKADERDPHGSMRQEEIRHPHETEMRPPSSMFTDISEQGESTDDDDDEEEEAEEEEEEDVVKPPEPPKKRGPGRPPKPESERKKKKRTGRLWEFIRNLLLNPETCPSIVKWEDAETGVFRFVQSEKVAERWGMRKNNQKMNYEKLSRAMRYYYKGKVFEPVLGRRLVYKFGSNAKGWKPNNANFGQ